MANVKHIIYICTRKSWLSKTRWIESEQVEEILTFFFPSFLQNKPTTTILQNIITMELAWPKKCWINLHQPKQVLDSCFRHPIIMFRSLLCRGTAPFLLLIGKGHQYHCQFLRKYSVDKLSYLLRKNILI